MLSREWRIQTLLKEILREIYKLFVYVIPIIIDTAIGESYIKRDVDSQVKMMMMMMI